MVLWCHDKRLSNDSADQLVATATLNGDDTHGSIPLDLSSLYSHTGTVVLTLEAVGPNVSTRFPLSLTQADKVIGASPAPPRTSIWLNLKRSDDEMKHAATKHGAAKCPCGAAVLCDSLNPQPQARPEVLAFHTPSFYTNPNTEHQAEPFFFHHYKWSHVTTVASFVGSEGRPGNEPSNWDTSSYTKELVCTAHQNNARVVAHLGHGAPPWPQLLNATWRTVWVAQIVDWFITQQGMDGVQFDVEDLQPQYTSAAADLACELRQALTATLPGSTLSWCSDSTPKVDPGYNFMR
eukprot:COSAG05_NODE_5409_length_1184_cov_1.238710_1_plen_292_part_01